MRFERAQSKTHNISLESGEHRAKKKKKEPPTYANPKIDYNHLSHFDFQK